MPWRLSPRSTTLEMSSSSVGSTRSSASNSVTVVPEPGVRGGDLGSRRAGADDREAGWPFRQGPGLLGSDHAAAELGARNRALHRAGGEDDRLGGHGLAIHGYLAGAGEGGLTLDQLDRVLLEQAGDATGERLDDLRAAGHHPVPLDFRIGDLDPEVARLADLAQHVGHAQDGLGGDAGVVQAAAADRVLLDHGRLHPELGGTDGGHVAAGAGADHDAVVRGFWHAAGDYRRAP